MKRKPAFWPIINALFRRQNKAGASWIGVDDPCGNHGAQALTPIPHMQARCGSDLRARGRGKIVVVPDSPVQWQILVIGASATLLSMSSMLSAHLSTYA